MTRIPASAFIVPFALLFAGCVPQATKVASDPPPTATPVVAGEPADDNLNAVAWTQTAIERDLIYRQTYLAAQDHLTAALADPDWDALSRDDRKGPLRGLKPAIILDIDETVLDNSPYQARLVRDGQAYDEFTWAKWCREEKAKALPGAVEFTRFAASKGVTVFYLSNRAVDLNDATLANLRSTGFPVSDDERVFLGLGTIVKGCEQEGSEKGCRRQLVGRKYRVLMQFGDQIGDFVDVVANTASGRESVIEPYLDWVGRRWFVLPNPTYGSWEPALFNNAWSQPAEERRRAKKAALRVD